MYLINCLLVYTVCLYILCLYYKLKQTSKQINVHGNDGLMFIVVVTHDVLVSSAG